MSEHKRSGVNPLVTGAVIAGAAVAAVALSKKENRDKAKKLIKEVAKKGKKIMEKPEAQEVVGAVAEKTLEKVVDKKEAKALVDAMKPQNGQSKGKSMEQEEGQGQKNAKKAN